MRGVIMASSRFASYFFMLLGVIAIAGSTYVAVAYPREMLSIMFPMFPVVVLILCVLMFLGGFYYYKAKMDDEARKEHEREREMLQKIVKKVVKGKSAS